MKPIRFLPKIQHGKKCLNCDLPLAGEENFCPNCGQRNDTRSLNFASFLGAIFSELISYDSRLWRTIIDLIIHPGKVSRDYINGKRFRYANPFRFYLTISIVFFVLLGFMNKYQELKGAGKSQSIININNDVDKTKDKLLENAHKKIDSLKAIHPKNKNLKKLEKIIDTPVKDAKIKTTDNNLKIDSLSLEKSNRALAKKIRRYNRFYKTHKALSVDIALDSLGEEQTFWNRFYYSKIKKAYKVIEDKGASLNKKIISNLSIALFVLLPVFTIFLKLLYIRRHLNYMEHLIFVFNTQSVFFLLMILLISVNFFTQNKSINIIFTFLFLVYLFLAMLKFYNQGWFKTFIKFSLLNMVYLTLTSIGLIFVSVLSFLFD